MRVYTVYMRNSYLNLRIDQKEKKPWVKAANLRGITLSEWIRFHLTNQAAFDIELSKQGALLSQ